MVSNPEFKLPLLCCPSLVALHVFFVAEFIRIVFGRKTWLCEKQNEVKRNLSQRLSEMPSPQRYLLKQKEDRPEFVVSVRCVSGSNNSLRNQTWSMIEHDVAARPSCVIGASVWASVLDKFACPNLAVPTHRTKHKKVPKATTKLSVLQFVLGGDCWHQLKLKKGKRNESNMINDYAWCGGAS